MNKMIVVAGATLALVLGSGGVAVAASPVPAAAGYFATCEDAAAAGQVNIPRSSPFYREELDSDGDGIACEREDGAPAAPAAAPDTERGEHEYGKGHEGDEEYRGGYHDGHHEEQVHVVPKGGAPTGDGSAGTAGSAATWGLGGGLIAALGVAVVASRPRVAAILRR